MSHKDNMDLRNTGDGGWFYAEHELFSVFVPLIGPDGGMVYMAMCRLIPLAGVDPDRPVTVRSVSEASGVSKSTAQRKMAQIVALGMVEETRYANRRPSAYRLPGLRKLALVGIEELRRRLGVPSGDTAETGSAPGAAPEAHTNGANSLARQASVQVPSTIAGLWAAKAPEGTGRDGVPPGDTESVLRKNSPVPTPVSQKQASVSQKEASVSQNGGPLFKEEKEEDNYTPLPLSQAKGVPLDSLSANASHNGNGKSKKPSHGGRGGDAGSDPDRERAVAKVKRECGQSNRRLDRVIDEALRLRASKTDERTDWNAIAERMAASYAIWLGNLHLMEHKPGFSRFITSLWDDQRKWPWDEKRLREIQRARVGS